MVRRGELPVAEQTESGIHLSPGRPFPYQMFASHSHDGWEYCPQTLPIVSWTASEIEAMAV